VLRALARSASQNGKFEATSNDGWFCKGDSGSGFVQLLNGIATVTGVASTALQSCLHGSPGDPSGFTDVHAHRAWILERIGRSADSIPGMTRLTWTGRESTGTMSLTCNTLLGHRTVTGPMNAKGAQIGINCIGVMSTIAATCKLDGTGDREIKAFTLRKADANGIVRTTDLPFTELSASYFTTGLTLVPQQISCHVGKDTDPPPVDDGTSL